MLKIENSGNGQAGNAQPETFFAQMIVQPDGFPGRFKAIPVPGSGIPIRDFFAAQALAGIAAALDSSRDTAEYAYRIADAMIEARKTEKPFNNSQFHEDHMSK